MEIVKRLANSLSIKYARGQRLDYIGAEVGASRDETDFGNYFCVNKLHLNETVQFYFLSSGQDPKSPLPLSDAEFIQKIYAYIGANASSGNTEEVIAIVKQITNADEVRIINGNNGGIKINICGSGLIITQNTAKYIKQICGSSIYIEEITTND